jgi:predicted acyl esterase
MAEPIEQDNMLIEWDAEIVMDDGLVLRADVFRLKTGGKSPVLLTYGPYAKGLAFQKATRAPGRA